MSFLKNTPWLALPAYVLVFLMVVFPLVPGLLYTKVFLLAVALVSIGIATAKTGRVGLHPLIGLWTYFLSALSFLFVLEAFFSGMTGAAEEVHVYVLWPLLYGLLIAGIRSERVLFGLMGTLVLATSCIAAYSLIYSLTQAHVIPDFGLRNYIIVDSERQIFASTDYGFLRMAYPGLNSLLFLVPFSLAAIVTRVSGTSSRLSLNRLWMWAAILLGPASVLLSGRRALYLVTLTAPFFTLVFLCFQPKAERDASRKALTRWTALGVLAAMLSIVSLNSLFGLKLDAVAKGFVTAFTFTATASDKGAAYRRQQYHALLAGWMESPMLGAGYGAPASGCIRSQAAPYKYELTYMALLHQIGLVGCAAYSAGILWIYCMGIRVIRAGGHLSALMVACLVGLSSILVANATNPYFGSFERMWPIFVPLALINYWLLRPGVLT